MRNECSRLQLLYLRVIDSTLMAELGKMLLGLGLLLVVIGAVLLIAARFGMPLGRLPGDFSWRGKNVSFFFPLGTSILLSVVLSIILYFISRFRR